MVSVITYLVVIAAVLAFATCCACYGYLAGFYYRFEFKKSNWWTKAIYRAAKALNSMQAVCSLLAVTLMVLTTKRLTNLV